MARWNGRIVIAAIVVVAAIAALSITGDLRAVGARVGTFAWWTFAAAIGLSVLNYAVRYGRWALYLHYQDISVPRSSRIGVFVAGLSLAITPGKVGELVKSYLLRELHAVPVTRSAPVVIAERVTDLTALVVLALIGVAIYGVAITATVTSAAVIAIGLLVLAWPKLAHAIIRAVTRPKFAARFRDRLIEIYDGIAALCRPVRLALATAIGGVGWLGECVGFALIVHGFPGASIDVGLAMLIYAVTTIVGALSFLPGGLGITEGAMTLLLVQSAHGLDTPTAVAAAVLCRIATLWFGVVLGLGGMAWTRRRIARLPASAAP
jgi:glycosyltransferase 2 family protein